MNETFNKLKTSMFDSFLFSFTLLFFERVAGKIFEECTMSNDGSRKI